MSVLPLDNFLCWKLKVAVFVSAIYVIITAGLACLLELLDICALADGNFEILGGFESHWRAHVWEGWLATNIVMMVCHLFMIGFSVLMIFAVQRFPTFYEFNLTKGYLVMMVCYILVEMGCGLYRYSWYAENTFRLGYLVFTFLYWLLRTIINIVVCIILYSRIHELSYEIHYGEKKTLDPFSSQANLIARSGMSSGMATPVPHGARTPQSYA